MDAAAGLVQAHLAAVVGQPHRDSDDPNEATVIGDLTLRGVTRPVTMEVEFHQAGPAMGGAYKAGFDGEATIRRSEFGINYALPAVSDEVELHLEGEFVLKS